MEFVNGSRNLSFEPQRVEPVSLERFWDEVAWQRRQLEEGDTLVPNPERRSFSVRYRSGGLPAERSAEVTATGTRTLFLNQHQWGTGTGKVGCGDCGALVRVERKDPEKLSGGELQDRVVDLAEARARLEGEYLAALGELASRSGTQGAAHRLREMNRMTAAAARSDASLALELMALGASLVADDQVVLIGKPEGLLMSAPTTLEGKIEARGIGILKCDATPAWLRIVVDMDHAETRRLPELLEIAISGERVRLIRRVETPAFASMLYVLLKGGLE